MNSVLRIGLESSFNLMHSLLVFCDISQSFSKVELYLSFLFIIPYTFQQAYSMPSILSILRTSAKILANFCSFY